MYLADVSSFVFLLFLFGEFIRSNTFGVVKILHIGPSYHQQMYTLCSSFFVDVQNFHNTKRVSSDKVPKSKAREKRNRKHPQGTVISFNEVWHHILKYRKIITNLNFVIIQTMFLETITEKSLQKTENLTNNNFSQSDGNVTNNSETIVRHPNELIQLLHTNLHLMKVNLQHTKKCSYTRLLSN